MQIIMHNCFSDKFKFKLGFCANLADMFNKLRRLVLSPEYLARSFSEVIKRWKKVTPYDESSELKFLQNVLKLESISSKGWLSRRGLLFPPCVCVRQIVIMPINEPNPDILREIEQLGFSIVDKFRLLGLEINNKLDNADAIYGGITAKIRNLILFWERFKLTLRVALQL